MSIQRKLRKLILHPLAFFRDSKLINSKKITASPTKAPAVINKNDIFSQEMEKAIRQILKFPSSYPVNNLRWKDGQMLWPAFRFYLTLLANYHIKNKAKTARVFQPFPAYQWRKYYLDNKFSTPIDDYECSEHYDFLVFSSLRSIAWANEQERIYDRLLDPLIEKLQSYGKTKKIIIVTASGELPDNLAIDPDFILFPAQYKINNAYNVDNFDPFANKVVSTFRQYNINKGDIAYFIDIFIYVYENYVKLLKKLNPKAVFFFPIDYSAPLIMAAHSLGIHAIDIQHGNMIGYYVQYNRWDEKSTQGYSLWPDAILTWSNREKEHIKKIFKNHINAVIFGYPWLETGIKNIQPLRKQSFNKFCANFKYIVIVSLSEHDRLPITMDAIVRDSRAKDLNIGFIFKRNPKRAQTIIPKLHNVYTDDIITASSFLNVAKYANLHMTEVSSCLYEADYIGLNTILTGNSWEFHFKDLVEAERVYMAQSADEFYSIFEKAVSFCHYPRLIDNHSDEFDNFMRTLM